MSDLDNHIEDLEVISDDAVLDFTQVMRRKFINYATKNGTSMPDDPKESKVLLTALSDLDRSALTKKRLTSENEASKQTAQQIQELADAVKASIIGNGGIAPPVARPAPIIDESGMEPLEIVDGETSVGQSTMTYEQFENRDK